MGVATPPELSETLNPAVEKGKTKMTKKIKWRLNQLPTPEELRDLVKDKIITQDEAREILFTEETKEDRDVATLEEEIKFLKQLVNKLSEGRVTKIVETIREVEKPYRHWGWYQPYLTFTSGSSILTTGTYTTNATTTGSTSLTTGGNTLNPFDL